MDFANISRKYSSVKYKIISKQKLLQVKKLTPQAMDSRHRYHIADKNHKLVTPN